MPVHAGSVTCPLLVGTGALPMPVHAGSVTCPLLVGIGLLPTPVHVGSITASRVSCRVAMCSGATHIFRAKSPRIQDILVESNRFLGCSVLGPKRSDLGCLWCEMCKVMYISSAESGTSMAV